MKGPALFTNLRALGRRKLTPTQGLVYDAVAVAAFLPRFEGVFGNDVFLASAKARQANTAAWPKDLLRCGVFVPATVARQ